MTSLLISRNYILLLALLAAALIPVCVAWGNSCLPAATRQSMPAAHRTGSTGAESAYQSGFEFPSILLIN